jgi:hypothetical protein
LHTCVLGEAKGAAAAAPTNNKKEYQVMTNSNNKPTHRAYTVKNFKGGKGEDRSRWLEIGTVFTHSDGEGFDVVLEAVPVDGRVTVRLAKAKEANVETTETAAK